MRKYVSKLIFMFSILCAGLLSAGNLSTAPPYPKPTTLPATNVTATSAQLNCSVNPLGYQTKVYFLYCFSCSPSSPNNSAWTPKIDVGNGNTAINASYTLKNLTPNTKYWYRCDADTPSSGISGDWVSFTTGIILFPTFTVIPITIPPTPFPTMSVIPMTTPPPTSTATPIPPSPTKGTIIVESNAGGFMVVIPGIFSEPDNDGDGRVTVVIEKGNYEIFLEKDGCEPSKTFVTVESGKTKTVNMHMNCEQPSMPPQPPQGQGTLLISSNVSGYRVFVDGMPRTTDSGGGTTSLLLDAGDHHIVLEREGCEGVGSPVFVEPNMTKSITIILNCQQPQQPEEPFSGEQPRPPPDEPFMEKDQPPPPPPSIEAGSIMLYAGMGIIILLLLILIIVLIMRGQPQSK